MRRWRRCVRRLLHRQSRLLVCVLRQTSGMLEQFGCGVGSAAPAGRLRRVLERLGRAWIRRDCRLSEVPRPLLVVVDQVRKSSV